MEHLVICFLGLWGALRCTPESPVSCLPTEVVPEFVPEPPGHGVQPVDVPKVNEPERVVELGFLNRGFPGECVVDA